MSEIRCCCLFLLVHIVTGADITSKFVCPGDSVQVFTNAIFDSCNAVVSLFVNGDRNMLIAKWILRDCNLNSSILLEYNDRVYFNKNGTILIHDIHPWDEGRYIMTKDDTLPMTYEEQIYVMAVPTKDCRPTIEQLGNSLSASLNHDVCGKPLATWYWKDCCGVSNSNESVFKLTPGKEACTCHACIVSQALICARNSTPLDYCSTIIIRGTNIPPVSLEKLEETMVVLVAVGIILVSLVLLVIIVMLILKRRRRNAKVRQRCKESKQSEEMQDLMWIRGMEPAILIGSDDVKVRQRYKKSKQSEEMQDLMWIRGMEPAILIGSDDPNRKTEESTKMLIREKGPCSGKCTFCGKENNEMFILACEHSGWFMPTCIKCASSPKPCELCKASNKKYIEYALWTDLADTVRN